MQQCTYTKDGMRCDQEATHYCVATFEDPHVWTVTDRPCQLENMDGSKRTAKQLDDRGEEVRNAQGLPVMVPLMHVREFCLQDAEIVCAERNARVVAAVAV